MTKTLELNIHFAKWRQQTRTKVNTFHADGIIDELTYSKAKVKLCFLMKEPNNPAKDDFGAKFDFREWWRDEPIKGAFTARIAEWSYGILNGFPAYDDVRKTDEGDAIQEVRKAIALVNVKKSGGRGSSDPKEFLHALGASAEQRAILAELVREELRIIAPDVVVMGLTWPKLRDLLFPNVEWNKSGYAVEVGKWEGRTLIDFYHPSSRSAPAGAYCLLEKVMRSAAFLNLIKVGKAQR